MEVELKTTFLPSEVARLVLGYLKEQRCLKAAANFLKDSMHLVEYRSMLDQGFSAPLTISGRTLVETLCLCQVEPAPAKRNTDQGELWGKLDHILSQLKSFTSSVSSKPSQMPVKGNKQARPVRIRQSGAEVKAKRKAGTDSGPVPVPVASGEVQADTSQPEQVESSRTKKHVTWNISVDESEAPEIGDSNSTVEVVSKQKERTTPFEMGEGDAMISSSASSGSDCLADAPELQSSHEIHAQPAATVFTSRLQSTNQLATSLSATNHLLAATATTSSHVTSLASLSASEGDQKAELTIPESHYDWSPYKKKEGKLQTPEKTEIDAEVSELLNQLFPMKNVVEKLVEDDSWAQDLARSINERKDSQSHLAEEKVPQVLDITKTDPNFTEFHSLLGGASRRKAKPSKKVAKGKPAGVQLPPCNPADVGDPNIEHQSQQACSADVNQPQQQTSGMVTSDAAQPMVMGLARGVRCKQLYSSSAATLADKDSGGGMSGYRKKTRSRKQTFKAVPIGSERNLSTSALPVSFAPSSVIDIWPAHQQTMNANAVLQPSNMYVMLPPPGVGAEAMSQSAFQPLTLVSTSDGVTAPPNLQPTLQVLTSSQHDLPQSTNLPHMSLATQPVFSTGPQANGAAIRLDTLPSIVTFTQTPDTGMVTASAGPQSTQSSAEPQFIQLSAGPQSTPRSTGPQSTQSSAESRSTQRSAGPQSTQLYTGPQSIQGSAGPQSMQLSTAQQVGNTQPLANATLEVTLGSQASMAMATQTPSKSSEGMKTPRKDDYSHLDLEQTTALLFSGASPAGKRKKRNGGRYNTSRTYTPSSVRPRVSPFSKCPSDGKMPPLAKESEAVNIVTAKWSPALQNLVQKFSPAKSGRRTAHVRHLSFSPKGLKPTKSPKRPRLCGSSKHKSLEVPSISTEEPPQGRSIQQLTSPTRPNLSPHPTRLISQEFTISSSTQSVGGGMNTPPSVGEPPFAGSPAFPYNNRLCSTPVQSPLVGNHSVASSSASLSSPAVQTLRRSPRAASKPSPSTRSLPARRIVPVARKGGPPISNRSTPSKGGSPSVVMAGKGGSITSITVAQSTPKGKNCVPTVISNSDLQKAVDAILDESTDNTFNPADSVPGTVYSQLISEEIVEASGMATSADNSTTSDDTVGVAQALMELASSESPFKSATVSTAEVPDCLQSADGTAAAGEPTDKAPADAVLGVGVSAPPSGYAASCGSKRKAAVSKQKHKQRRTPRKMSDELKRMSVQAMLDMIHK